VTIVRKGRNVETGSLAEMRHMTDTSVDVTLQSPPPALDRIPGISAVQFDGNRVECNVPTERIGELLNELGPYGITALTCQPPTLEQLFLRHNGDQELPPDAASQPRPRSGASA
jgi:ABC-2 type transport system ATP-binding protein